MRHAALLVALLLGGALLAGPAWAESPGLLERHTTLAPTGAPGCPSTTYATARPLQEAPEKPWHVTLAGYVWMIDISGSSWTDGVESDVDIGFEDLFDKLDYSFQGVVEFEWKRWTLGVDSTFQKLSQDGPLLVRQIPTTLSLEQTAIDVRLGYTILCREIGRDQWGCCCYPRRYKLDLHVGARYWNLETSIDLDQPVFAAAPLNGVSETVSWWDPYVGMRVRWPFAKRWFFNLYGDVGGFGIGDASDLTWQIQATLGFRITRWLFAGVGYRALDVDRVHGSGADKQGEDLMYHGPAVFFGVTF